MDSKKSRPLDLDDFQGGNEWDEEDFARGNLDHCLDHGIDEQVVEEVLDNEWVNIEITVDTAEFAIVGPNQAGNYMWTLLFAPSQRRGDMLRPVTGCGTRSPRRLGNGND